MPTSLLRRSVAGLFMVGIPEPHLDAATRRVLTEHPPGGVVLFRRNVRSAGQLRDLVSCAPERGAGARRLTPSAQGGGGVARRRPPFPHSPAAAVVAQHGGVRAIEAVGLAMARELAAVGIDIDFAPVLDVL